MSRPLQNTLVLLAAFSAIGLLILTQTNCMTAVKSNIMPRERCFGLALATANLCAENLAECDKVVKSTPDASSWLLLPVGVCAKLGGWTVLP